MASVLNRAARALDHSLFGSGTSEPKLEEFRVLQQLAYQCAEEVAAGFEPGVTEREAVRRMRRWLEAAGVDDWFHTPFAWFGDRTAFTGFHLPHQFLPTGRRLEAHMPFILDCAPVRNGACADIGLSGVIGEHKMLGVIWDALADHRALIVERVRGGATLAQIYRDVDRLAARQGLTNRHRAYPGKVLAHRVEALAPGHARGIAVTFGVRQLRALAGDIVEGRRRGTSPLWNGDRRSEHRATPGLWAVEPHLAYRDVGAKFEELLVVTEDDAYWLDDDLPHVRRWAARHAAGAS